MKPFLSKQIFLSFGLLLCMSFTLPGRKIKIYLAGDSTMSVKEMCYYPETGWGMPFVAFFDSSSVTIENKAKNGRSTHTFIEEKRWESIEQNLKENDYVFIQFGHNDEVSTKKSYTPENEFSLNLKKFIAETKAKKAIPVLLTPVARRKFDSLGVLINTHAVYSNLVRKVAEETGVAFIDLDLRSQELLQMYGPEKSKLVFNHLAKGEHPNYPAGLEDDTHFNELGARKVAELVLAEMIKLKLPLTAYVVKAPEKK